MKTFLIVFSQNGMPVFGFIVAWGHACTTAVMHGSSPRDFFAAIADCAMQRRFAGVISGFAPRFAPVSSWEPLVVGIHDLEELVQCPEARMPTSGLLNTGSDPRQLRAAVELAAHLAQSQRLRLRPCAEAAMLRVQPRVAELLLRHDQLRSGGQTRV